MSNEHDSNQAVSLTHPLLVSQEKGKYTVSEPVSIEQLYQIVSDLLEEQFTRKDLLTNPDVTKRYLQVMLAQKEQEVFSCVFLDNQHRVISYDEMFYGTIDGASVHPREVAKRALKHNAAALILAHNHPSGVAEPSQADIQITSRLKEALSLVDVRVIDHIVIAGHQTISLAERGLL